MAAFATVLDVEDRLQRPLTEPEMVAVGVFLEQLSALIRMRMSMIDDRVAADANLFTVTRGVVADAVVRVVRNPSGKVQESIDDYTYRRADAVADGLLYLTENEWAALEPSTVQSSAAFTIRPWVKR